MAKKHKNSDWEVILILKSVTDFGNLSQSTKLDFIMTSTIPFRLTPSEIFLYNTSKKLGIILS
jgi:hypothetical protein